ncbi:hypothetical protein LXL04_002802 [Taraxacum kok-saghyz]
MASQNNIVQTHLPKFTGKNYFHWSIQMRVLFESQDLWEIIEDGITEYNFFIQNIKGGLDMLHRTYRGEDKVKIVRLQTLWYEFDNIKMNESESVEDFYDRVILLLNQMRLNGEAIEDKRVVEKILRSLTRKFEYVVVAIEESKYLSTLSLENLLGILQSHELRMRNFDDTSPTEQAFYSQAQSKECSIDNGEGVSKSKRVDGKFMNEDDLKANDTMFMTFETDELIKNDVYEDLTEKNDLIVAVDNALHSKFWRLD